MLMEMRSAKIMNGRMFAGARALYRAAGVDSKDFGKPIIAIANSFDPVRPRPRAPEEQLGDLVAGGHRSRPAASPSEFNTIAVDDGIAMGHDGMLYSLPSRDLIADCGRIPWSTRTAPTPSMCISNCDKITPGMLLAAIAPEHPHHLRLRRPHGSRRRRAAGRRRRSTALDLIDVMVTALPTTPSATTTSLSLRAHRVPDLRLLRRHVHRELDELPQRRRSAWPCPATAPPWPPTIERKKLFDRGRRAASSTCASAVLRAMRTTPSCRAPSPRRHAFENAMTPGRGHGRLHQHRPAHSRHRQRGCGRRLHARRHRTRSRAAVPCLCKVIANSTTYHIDARPPRRRHHRHPRRARPRRQAPPRCAFDRLPLARGQARRVGRAHAATRCTEDAKDFYRAAPGRVRHHPSRSTAMRRNSIRSTPTV